MRCSPNCHSPTTTRIAATIAWVDTLAVLMLHPVRYMAYTPSSIPATDTTNSHGAQCVAAFGTIGARPIRRRLTAAIITSAAAPYTKANNGAGRTAPGIERCAR